jgi:arsenite methyltransferase
VSETKCCASSTNPGNQVRALYTALAQQPERDFGWDKGRSNAQRLGYDPAWLARLPDCVWESAAAVGNPFALGPLHPGETVVDIGCGAGADLCVAALFVGATGQAIGLDLTPAMAAKARVNAQQAGLHNVTVLEANIENLPLPPESADVVISNGAINLAPDKARVFREIHRILRPGGRFQFADMVRRNSGCDAITKDGSWADCVAGTLPPEQYIELLQAAGFQQVELAGWTGYRTASNTEGATFRAIKTAIVTE